MTFSIKPLAGDVSYTYILKVIYKRLLCVRLYTNGLCTSHARKLDSLMDMYILFTRAKEMAYSPSQVQSLIQSNGC